MSEQREDDLDADELGLDRMLRAAPRVPPPLGFRDGVMRRVAGGGVFLEWAAAAALAIPSFVFLLWELAVEGVDLEGAFDDVLALTTGAPEQAFFAVDGMLVLAFALLGVGALVGSHALLRRAS